MKHISLLLAALVLSVAISSLPAEAQSSWQGSATNMSRTVNYGKVTFKVVGSKIRNFTVQGVTSGCGFKSVVVPTLRIRGRRFSGSYQPVPGLDDIITVNGTFNGTRASGTFVEGPLCSAAGRFSARRK